VDVNQIVEQMNAHAPAAVRKLGGRVHGWDEEDNVIEMRYQVDDSFCHSGGIVQGGFVAGMLDAAMAHVVFASLREFVVVATLEMKVSYFDIARAGELSAFGRITKLGKSIGFLEAELKNADGHLLAAATSTAKIIRKQPGG
jgi:uncharacterized protein (TIGR00369 family)